MLLELIRACCNEQGDFHTLLKTQEHAHVVKMSAEEENVDTNDFESENKGKKIAKYDSGAADLEKVTDYVEEAEFSSHDIGEVSLNTK